MRGSPIPDSSRICGDLTVLARPQYRQPQKTAQGRTNPAETMTSPPSLVKTVCFFPSTVNSTLLAINPSPGADKIRETGAFTSTLMFGRDAACFRYACEGSQVSGLLHDRNVAPLTTDEERRLVNGFTDETSMENPTRSPACYRAAISTDDVSGKTGEHTGSTIRLNPRASKVSCRGTSQPGCSFGKESTSGPTRDVASEALLSAVLLKGLTVGAVKSGVIRQMLCLGNVFGWRNEPITLRQDEIRVQNDVQET